MIISALLASVNRTRFAIPMDRRIRWEWGALILIASILALLAERLS